MERPISVSTIFSMDDPSRVAEVRRAAALFADEENLGEARTSDLAIVVTEVCTNLVKHAKGGEVCLSKLSERGVRGVEVLALDHGPGITDLDRCLSDGYSSTQTSGNGLGAVSRLSQRFDIYTQPDKGTVLMAQVLENGRVPAAVGAVVKPMAGETASGDSWACAGSEDSFFVIVADGLGHGVMAAQASVEAVAAFRRSKDRSPVLLLQDVHRALRSTRGAAVAVMELNFAQGDIKFAGVGNIAGVICSSGKSQFMVSHAGTAGFGSPKIQVFSYSLPEGALIIMHSDGLTTSWSLDEYPGIRKHHPSVIAGILYRDASRKRDDTCVVAIKAEHR
jgi:anti-sigma regulatory factor (Ser/Thr protein kinase)